MCIRIRSVEDHKTGSFSVNVDMSGVWRKFESMMDAQKWIKLMRSGTDEQFHIDLREVVIMPRKELVYESSYTM